MNPLVLVLSFIAISAVATAGFLVLFAVNRGEYDEEPIERVPQSRLDSVLNDPYLDDLALRRNLRARGYLLVDKLTGHEEPVAPNDPGRSYLLADADPGAVATAFDLARPGDRISLDYGDEVVEISEVIAEWTRPDVRD